MKRPMRRTRSLSVFVLLGLFATGWLVASPARAQTSADPAAPPSVPADPSASSPPLAPLPPPTEPPPTGTAPPTATVAPTNSPPTPPAGPSTSAPAAEAVPPTYDAMEPPPTHEPPPEPVSEGKLIVLAYNTGFQWSLSPGVIFAGGKTGFAFGARFGYGIETGPVILVPGVKLDGYFLDPNVYLGMPMMKVVLPIDRFAPFVEGGAGVGHVTDPAKTGLAAFGGVGFMIHPSASFAIGAEGTYQAILGTDFSGFGIGPILAIAF